MYKYLFGPVPSRRLGISLGIDLVPYKTCTLNCIYCECGKTTNLTLDRKEWVPTKNVIEELEHYLNNHTTPDTVTFSGSGEPTLHLGIGEILNYLNSRKDGYKTAILTNGTLFYDKQVREQILSADLVLPSLDAALNRAFKKINRPHPELKIEQIIEGLIAFRKEFSGLIYLEVFIVPGINDKQQDLLALKEAILKIKPDGVQLNTLDRPGAISTIRAATRSELKQILEFWQLPNAEIIAKPVNRKMTGAYRNDIESAILETIARRPSTLEDLAEILNLHINEINKYLDVLEAQGKIKVTLQGRGFFYSLR
ncbi:MAG TPA: radical SAM protein [Caldithrix abyssi]|uniref:Radical SAM protein n=1 Tax=Caldithrix abyssi TaxID=187145 RepID=A0A7V5H298_CALAY|nr:radical SAM protein [Caldisericaceae bacterium]HHE54332.1 radical SAM protein [Caldithrix abyssi]